MSILDKYAEYKSNSKPSDNTARRLLDPNFLTPDTFFMMDEVDGKQILRKYDKASGFPVYIGTYQVLYKTEDLGKFCLIMKRIGNEWKVPDYYADLSDSDENTFTVAEYYPGTHSRIYLKGLTEQAFSRVVSRYERKKRKKLPFKTGK